MNAATLLHALLRNGSQVDASTRCTRINEYNVRPPPKLGRKKRERQTDEQLGWVLPRAFEHVDESIKLFPPSRLTPLNKVHISR